MWESGRRKIGVELRKRYLFQNRISKGKETKDHYAKGGRIQIGKGEHMGFSLVRFEVGVIGMMTTGQ